MRTKTISRFPDSKERRRESTEILESSPRDFNNGVKLGKPWVGPPIVINGEKYKVKRESQSPAHHQKTKNKGGQSERGWGTKWGTVEDTRDRKRGGSRWQRDAHGSGSRGT